MRLADQQKDSKESVRAPSGMIMRRVDSRESEEILLEMWRAKRYCKFQLV